MIAGSTSAADGAGRCGRGAAWSRLTAGSLRLVAVSACVALLAGRLIRQPTLRTPVEDPVVVYSVWLKTGGAQPRLVVTLQAPVRPGEKSVTLQMPVWSPGDYHTQNLGKYVQGLHASGLAGSRQTGELAVQHPDLSTWQIDANGQTAILVTYSVQQTPPGIFSDNVTLAAHYAFVNGPSAFAYVAGHKDWKTALNLYLPPTWRAETALPFAGAPTPGTEAFTAPDYDTLADSPIVMADAAGMTVSRFEVDRVPLRAVFFHKPLDQADVNAYVPDLKKIAQAENDIMGGPPYSQYDFLFDVGGGGGGLEHKNSARILLWPAEPPSAFDSFVAHEFFHLWNVKRIRPAVLGPFDYIHPPKTRNLWFAEGVTEYYAHVALRRAGLTTEGQFLNHWKGAIARLQANPARRRVTADEASMNVWESGDSQGYGGLSYYDKGELIGLCLDLKIRQATGGARSLDDLMRLLLLRHNPPQPGYGEDELRATVSEVAGQDLGDFYDRLARSTQEMPFDECLGYAGLDSALNRIPDAPTSALALRSAWAVGPHN